MKTLYLVRHAKSSWKNEELDDFDRPLNKRGKKDAPFMGKKLRKLWDAAPELILSSPAKRARKTARKMAKKLHYPKKKIVYIDGIYEATEATLLKILHEQSDTVSSLMIFGHNPSLTALCNLLGNEAIENIPTAGVVCLTFNVDSWSSITVNSGKLVFFDYPKRYEEAIEAIEKEEESKSDEEENEAHIVDDVE
ncbi:MAG: histidine phosphatase family protein [Flammeovirgaceae bacterium]|nr:histidine phosphatase family protein [Flammeovirgaceae bacterium]